MIILQSKYLPTDVCNEPSSPLNAVWSGEVTQSMQLPNLGHIMLLFPLQETNVLCANVQINAQHYVMLTDQPANETVFVQNLHLEGVSGQLLILFLSPGFIAEMASFLGISQDFQSLLHALPLPKGDDISLLLQSMTANLNDRVIIEELIFEVIGHVLRLLRVRHQALLRLSNHKNTTLDDLVPRLMQARQYIEAQYLEPVKTKHVAHQVALSEYHFARLFKTAFDTTVHQYVIQLRLKTARHLLESTQLPVTDVSLSVGYNSLSAFIHAFRNQIGMTPSQYQTLFLKSKISRI